MIVGRDRRASVSGQAVAARGARRCRRRGARANLRRAIVPRYTRPSPEPSRPAVSDPRSRTAPLPYTVRSSARTRWVTLRVVPGHGLVVSVPSALRASRHPRAGRGASRVGRDGARGARPVCSRALPRLAAGDARARRARAPGEHPLAAARDGRGRGGPLVRCARARAPCLPGRSPGSGDGGRRGASRRGTSGAGPASGRLRRRPRSALRARRGACSALALGQLLLARHREPQLQAPVPAPGAGRTTCCCTSSRTPVTSITRRRSGGCSSISNRRPGHSIGSSAGPGDTCRRGSSWQVAEGARARPGGGEAVRKGGEHPYSRRRALGAGDSAILR